MPDQFRILSIDGGGIRGLIPAIILSELEDRAGKPISSMFDLIAGTSTGGILALGLTKPDGHGVPAFSATDLVNLYTEKGPKIFSRSLWHTAVSVGGFTEQKYSAKPLEAVLEEYFGATLLSEALTGVLVTAYETELRAPWFFRSTRARTRPAEYDFPMKEAARATSAAPTYFPAARIDRPTGSPRYWSLIDGGTFANNPTMCGISEALSTHEREPKDLWVLSLGTGVQTRSISYKQARRWGKIGWALPILDVVFDGVSGTVDYQASQVCHAVGGLQHYFRLQTPLDIARDDLDDASADNIHKLTLQARRLVTTSSAEISRVVTALP